MGTTRRAPAADPGDPRPAPAAAGPPGGRGRGRPAAESWIIAVGDELLDGHTLDTNSAWLAAQLRATPFPCRRMAVVPDQEAAIVSELAAAIAGPAARVFCCGGLGPTPDDRTLAAVARALGVPLREHPAALAHIEGVVTRMHAAGWVASPVVNPGNRKMALVPEGATMLRNRAGMAPPLAIALSGDGDRWLFVVPGVPRELRTVVAEEILPAYCAGAPAATSEDVTYRGIGESTFYPLLRELAETFPDVRFGSYPRPTGGEVVIRATAANPERLRLAVDALRARSDSLTPRRSPAG